MTVKAKNAALEVNSDLKAIAKKRKFSFVTCSCFIHVSVLFMFYLLFYSLLPVVVLPVVVSTGVMCLHLDGNFLCLIQFDIFFRYITDGPTMPGLRTSITDSSATMEEPTKAKAILMSV